MRVFDGWEVISPTLFQIRWQTGTVPSPLYFFSGTNDITIEHIRLIRRSKYPVSSGVIQLAWVECVLDANPLSIWELFGVHIEGKSDTIRYTLAIKGIIQ